MGFLTVVANGQHLTVDIQTPAGHEAATFSDSALSTPITLPLVITADQDFYFGAGTNVVSVTVTTSAGVTLVDAEQREVGVSDHVVVTPLPSRAQEAATDSAASGGSSAVTLRHFDFAYNTPGLVAGVAAYTPAIAAVPSDPTQFAVLDLSLTQESGLPGPLTADPIKVCVSTDGTTGGSDPGATQGHGTLYLLVATPS